MLEQVLVRSIPNRLETFPKLTPGKDPYHFQSWDTDEDTGEPVLRYWFWSRDRTKKHKKRVFVVEAKRLLRSTCGTAFISRDAFREYCPRTNSDGECGFAVIIGILKYLGVVCSLGRGMYQIVDQAKARQLAGDV